MQLVWVRSLQYCTNYYNVSYNAITGYYAHQPYTSLLHQFWHVSKATVAKSNSCHQRINCLIYSHPILDERDEDICFDLVWTHHCVSMPKAGWLAASLFTTTETLVVSREAAKGRRQSTRLTCYWKGTSWLQQATAEATMSDSSHCTLSLRHCYTSCGVLAGQPVIASLTDIQ